jgi:hypothetical protein
LRRKPRALSLSAGGRVSYSGDLEVHFGIATAIAVTVLGRVEFAVFATAYFLAQVPILLLAVLVFRWMRVADGNQIPGVDNP